MPNPNPKTSLTGDYKLDVQILSTYLSTLALQMKDKPDDLIDVVECAEEVLGRIRELAKK